MCYFLFVAGCLFFASGVFAGDERLAAADNLYAGGNYREALEIYRKEFADASVSEGMLAKSIQNAYNCQERLNEISGWDSLIESAQSSHPQSWRIVLAVSKTFTVATHNGYIQDGKFVRGYGRNRGRWVNVESHDRLYCLRRLWMLHTAMQQDSSCAPGERQAYYDTMAWLLINYSLQRNQSWRLQILSDLSVEPEWESSEDDEWTSYGGAPVDDEGNPVFYKLPDSWENAANDGERWRWCLHESAQCSNNPETEKLEFASFMANQFEVHTLRDGMFDEAVESISSILKLHELRDDETIARLACGIKKFTFPRGLAPIVIYKSIPANNPSYYTACCRLAEIYRNRRQYDQALHYYQEALNLRNDKWLREAIEDLQQEWCMLLPGNPIPYGQPATLSLRYRNAGQVKMTAWKIDVEKMYDETWQEIENKAGKREWQKMNLTDLAARIYSEYDEKEKKFPGKSKYFMGSPLSWQQPLPRVQGHYDQNAEVETPLREPGMYLVEAQVGDGHVSRRVVYIEAMRIVSRPLAGKKMYWQVLDSATGKPVPHVKLDFNFWNDYRDDRKVQRETYSVKTDENGMAVIDSQQLHGSNLKYLIKAKDESRDLYAILSSHRFFRGESFTDRQESSTRTFGVTDRPVYRPGDKVCLRYWLTDATYGNDCNDYSMQNDIKLVIYGPEHQEVFSQLCKADAYGAIDAEWTIPADAKLGRYSFAAWSNNGGKRGMRGYGRTSFFRVEEYKKPEYEVAISAPAEPLQLGDQTKLTLTAKYYFGGPVTEAEVKVTILRSDFEHAWWPWHYWDWLYGNGYGWLWTDCFWHPGWWQWGTCAPRREWGQQRRRGGHGGAPELVGIFTGKIKADGTFDIPLDTTSAFLIYGDRDHKYQITAEVRDQSRHTITANSSVIAARKPFQVYVETTRGFYHVGQTIRAEATASRLDGVKVRGRAVFKLYRLRFAENGSVQEKLCQELEAEPSQDDVYAANLRPVTPGQYRVACQFRDGKERLVEGAVIITVRGDNPGLETYRFNGLELVPDKAEYVPGEVVRLAVNTNLPDSTVMLFLRPSRGTPQDLPKVVHLQGQTQIIDIQTMPDDAPNFFVEAYTLANGMVYNECCEIKVPPAQRILNVEVVSVSERVKPGENVRAKIRVTDATGKAQVACLTLGVYDKRVDAIGGDCLPGDIKTAFWSWRRYHNLEFTQMPWWFGNSLMNEEKYMPVASIFEWLAAEVSAEDDGFSNGASEVAKAGAPRMKMMSARAPAPMAGKMDMVAADCCESNAIMMEEAAETRMSCGVYGGEAEEEAADAGLESVKVRSNFADTAFWKSRLLTDVNGEAVIEIPLPESLTTWKINAWSIGDKSQVGYGSAEVITAKDLMVRLVSPRFFVEKDQVVISAMINSYLENPEDVTAILEIEGEELSLAGVAAKQQCRVAPGQTVRVDWPVTVVREGQPKLRVKVLSVHDSDGMEQSFPVYVHGMEKQLAVSRFMQIEQQEPVAIELDVPEAIREKSAKLTVRWSPSLALAMLDAVPYLAEYPYGCTEQTLNRFLPAVLCRRSLDKLGVKLEDIRNFKNNLNAQELGDAATRKAQWQRWDSNPVFEEATLTDMVHTGISNLVKMQCSDGGWGWFSGYGEHSWAHTTAQVVHGLLLARANGVDIPGNTLERGIKWLSDYQRVQVGKLTSTPAEKGTADALDALVFKVLSEAGVEIAKDEKMARMAELLFRDKNQLSFYAKALFAWGLQLNGEKNYLPQVMRNLDQYLKYDAENQTAYLELGNGGYWWYWYGDEIEAHATYLRLLIALKPGSEIAPALVKYLLNNRKHGTYWRSTRDTAACLEAFAEYLTVTGEDKPDMTVEVLLDGKKIGDARITAENIFTCQTQIEIPGLAPGEHTVTVNRDGRGPLYINSYLTYFSLEDFIRNTGLEVKVQRKIYRLFPEETEISGVSASGSVVGKTVQKYRRELLPEDAQVNSGDLLEVVLLLESKNDYEYILLEDFKPAGCEAVDTRSGYIYDSLGAYVEYRDNRVAMMIRSLRRGSAEISYRLRAEIPGKFSALPAVVQGMYAPELKGNSDEAKITICE